MSVQNFHLRQCTVRRDKFINFLADEWFPGLLVANNVLERFHATTNDAFELIALHCVNKWSGLGEKIYVVRTLRNFG